MSVVVRLFFLVMCWHGSSAAPNQGLGYSAFEGYCGHAAELNWAAKPLEDAELVQVHVVHRHGARTLWKPMSCWAPAPGAGAEGPTFRNCNLEIASAVGKEQRLLKQYDLPGHCGVGALLPEANEQFWAGAASLNATYGQVPWWGSLKPEDPWSVHLYSCDNDRNLGSLDMLINHMFPRSRANKSSWRQLRVHTRPEELDPWSSLGVGVATGPPCSTEARTSPAAELVEADPEFKRFKQQWYSAANVTWDYALFDCVLTSRCYGAQMPAGISDELATEALHWGFLVDAAPLRSTNWTSLWIAEALKNLTDHLDDATRGKSPRLFVWSTHDFEMMYVLEALSAWDGKWPGYASMITLELYRQPQGEEQYFVRFLRGGQPLRLGACGDKVVCPLRELKASVQHWYDAALAGCKVPPGQAFAQHLATQGRPSSADKPMENSPGVAPLLICAIAGCLFWASLQLVATMVAPRLFRKARARYCGASGSAPLLSSQV